MKNLLISLCIILVGFFSILIATNHSQASSGKNKIEGYGEYILGMEESELLALLEVREPFRWAASPYARYEKEFYAESIVVYRIEELIPLVGIDNPGYNGSQPFFIDFVVHYGKLVEIELSVRNHGADKLPENLNSTVWNIFAEYDLATIDTYDSIYDFEVLGAAFNGELDRELVEQMIYRYDVPTDGHLLPGLKLTDRACTLVIEFVKLRNETDEYLDKYSPREYKYNVITYSTNAWLRKRPLFKRRYEENLATEKARKEIEDKEVRQKL